MEGDARFMTTVLVVDADSEQPDTAEFTFILTDRQLITLRRADPKAFRAAAVHLRKHPPRSKEEAFLHLLEQIVDLQADLLERVYHGIDRVSRRIFTQKRKTAKETEDDLREAIYQIGNLGDLLSRERESLMTTQRLLQYAGTVDDSGTAHRKKGAERLYHRLKPIIRDAQSISDQAGFLANKVAFTLDATLGLISFKQNSIVKIFSVAAVIFLPPTLVASIYGMNFKYMPALDEPWGYPLALGLMAVSIVLPLLYVRWRGWL
jgi:magnesium transporter